MEEAVGLVVAHEPLGLGVPAELAAEPEGDVAQVADHGDAVADLDVHDRAAAGPHALEEVAHVVAAVLEGDLAARWLEHGLPLGGKVVPEGERIAIADEPGAVLPTLGLAGLVPAEGPVGVLELPCGAHGDRVVVEARVAGASGLDRDGAGVVNVHGPGHDADDVGAAVPDVPAAAPLEPSEGAVAAARMIGHVGEWPEPEVPVEALRRLLGRRGGMRGVGVVPAADLADAPAATVADVLRHVAARHRAPLGAELHHAAVAARGLHCPAALDHCHRERLLAVDVLARLARVDGVERVPVVGRADDHSVNVLPVEELAVVVVCLRPLPRDAMGVPQPALVHVAHGDGRGVWHAHDVAQEPAAPAADADMAGGHAVARRLAALCPQRVGGQHVGGCQPEGDAPPRAGKECASAQLLAHFPTSWLT